jgi:hypothetical protein
MEMLGIMRILLITVSSDGKTSDLLQLGAYLVGGKEGAASASC